MTERVLISLAVAALWPLLTAASCATTGGPEPEIRTVRVEVPVVQPCADGRQPPPAFPDDRATVRALVAEGKIAEATQLVWAGWPLHWQRHDEDDAQIGACAGKPAPRPP